MTSSRSFSFPAATPSMASELFAVAIVSVLEVLAFSGKVVVANAILRGYPETITRGVTSVGQNVKIPCGRRFYAAERDDLLAVAAIVGGRDAQPGEFPFVVSLSNTAKDLHFCGGSLISPQHVLTAAHCLQKKRVNLKAHVREYNIARRTEVPVSEAIGVAGFVLHPGWDPLTLRHDLAIITLNKTVSLDNFAQPICLPCCPFSSYSKGVDNMVGQNLTIAGWGATQEGGKMSPILQQVQVPIVDNNSCKNILFPQFSIQDTHVCAGYTAGGKDSCQGDSGGPLFRQESGFMTIEGIVSAGIGCARVGMPGVYTRVSEYVPWITSVMAQTPKA